MNCAEANDLLQQRLDGNPSADGAALNRHLEQCPECRGLHAAATRLEAGLHAMLPPLPPARLRASLVSAALDDYGDRTRKRRWLMVGAGAAAAMLLIALSVAFIQRNGAQPSPTGPVRFAATQPEKGVRDNVAEASLAVVSLTRRTAEETRAQTRLLTEALPMTTPLPPLEVTPPGWEPPVQTVLQEAGQRVSSGLEPVTSSARRAFSMFVREAPGRPVSQ